jgi:hypothetical protein
MIQPIFEGNKWASQALSDADIINQYMFHLQRLEMLPHVKPDTAYELARNIFEAARQLEHRLVLDAERGKDYITREGQNREVYMVAIRAMLKED